MVTENLLLQSHNESLNLMIARDVNTDNSNINITSNSNVDSTADKSANINILVPRSTKQSGVKRRHDNSNDTNVNNNNNNNNNNDNNNGDNETDAATLNQENETNEQIFGPPSAKRQRILACFEKKDEKKD